MNARRSEVGGQRGRLGGGQLTHGVQVAVGELRRGEKKAVFLVRFNNSTRELTGAEAFNYHQKHGPS